MPAAAGAQRLWTHAGHVGGPQLAGEPPLVLPCWCCVVVVLLLRGGAAAAATAAAAAAAAALAMHAPKCSICISLPCRCSRAA